jgi:hypothetical protein
MRKRLVVLLMALGLLVMSAAPVLAVPPQENEHNCYGYSGSRAAQGEDVAGPTPVSGRPGNEISAFQQGAREEFANCGANRGGARF